MAGEDRRSYFRRVSLENMRPSVEALVASDADVAPDDFHLHVEERRSMFHYFAESATNGRYSDELLAAADNSLRKLFMATPHVGEYLKWARKTYPKTPVGSKFPIIFCGQTGDVQFYLRSDSERLPETIAYNYSNQQSRAAGVLAGGPEAEAEAEAATATATATAAELDLFFLSGEDYVRVAKGLTRDRDLALSALTWFSDSKCSVTARMASTDPGEFTELLKAHVLERRAMYPEFAGVRPEGELYHMPLPEAVINWRQACLTVEKDVGREEYVARLMAKFDEGPRV